ncbi:MAG: TRAP transporter large permease subunit, partial [Gammaproteobacteria bacterium]|nr:TRAP transporter large permease subunit [Gammaproteobacteria bacterium]
MLLTIAITAALIFLALSGMPIFAVIAATALIGFYLSDIEVTVVAIELYRIVDTPMLVALPLFTLAGYLLAESRASHRLVRTAQAAIGWLPGGLGIIALVTVPESGMLRPRNSWNCTGCFPELMSVWQGGSTNATPLVPLIQLSHSQSILESHLHHKHRQSRLTLLLHLYHAGSQQSYQT